MEKGSSEIRKANSGGEFGPMARKSDGWNNETAALQEIYTSCELERQFKD
jgi:hypothetical protein